MFLSAMIHQRDIIYCYFQLLVFLRKQAKQSGEVSTRNFCILSRVSMSRVVSLSWFNFFLFLTADAGTSAQATAEGSGKVLALTWPFVCTDWFVGCMDRY